MRTAIQYVRFSSKPQELGDSERRQVDAGQAWAVANGFAYRQIVDRGLIPEAVLGAGGVRQPLPLQ